jgi:hypothetical protein
MNIKQEAKQKYNDRTSYSPAEWNKIKNDIRQNVFDSFVRPLVLNAADSGAVQVTISNAFKNCLMLYSKSLPTPISQGKIDKIISEKGADFNTLLQAWLESEGLVVTNSSNGLLVSGWA